MKPGNLGSVVGICLVPGLFLLWLQGTALAQNCFECPTQTLMPLAFDPNAFSIAVYDPKFDTEDTRVPEAMAALGINDPNVFHAGKPITLEVLSQYDVLIVSELVLHNASEALSGLDPNVIRDGINGRIIITGHDIFLHIGENQLPPETWCRNALAYILEGAGTGLLVLGWSDETLDALPASWNLSAHFISLGQTNGRFIDAFTPVAAQTGLYNGLCPADMTYTGSYQFYFESYTSFFEEYEQGHRDGPEGNELVTIGAMNPGLYTVALEDDVDPSFCRDVGQEITYTVCYENRSGQTLADAALVAFLPEGVDYPPGEWTIDPNTLEIIPGDPNYDAATHTYTWNLGTVLPTEPNVPVCAQLTVVVNDCAEPSGTLAGRAELQTGTTAVARDFEESPVCSGDPNQVIYVNTSASESCESGRTWATAYADLQKALARARNGCGNEIWVACGTYLPGCETDDSFEIPDGVALYGGFSGNETARSQRDWKKYKSILSGKIDDTTRSAEIVVPGDNSIIDGFFIEEGDRGIHTDSQAIAFSVINSLIQNNDLQGLNIEDADAFLEDCVVFNNSSEGIRFHNFSSGHVLEVQNCRIHDNNFDGIRIDSSQLRIKNSLVYDNGTGVTTYGLRLVNLSADSAIFNCTIAHNKNEGIRRDSGSQPDIRNCIIWDNDEIGDPMQLIGIDAFYYSCVNDPNDPNQVVSTPDVNGNISANPNFAYKHPPYGFYHLEPNSPCIDLGDNTIVDLGDLDIDSDDRIFNSIVDMGADELTCNDTSNRDDLNFDGVINYVEFARLADEWVDPNGFPDLLTLASHWLWQACWHQGFYETMILSGDGEGIMMLFAMEGLSSDYLSTDSPITLSLEQELQILQDTFIWIAQLQTQADIMIDEKQPDWEEWLKLRETLGKFKEDLIIYYKEVQEKISKE